MYSNLYKNAIYYIMYLIGGCYQYIIYSGNQYYQFS